MTMKFDGSNVVLTSYKGGITIHLKRGTNSLVELNLSEEDGAKLLSFLITAYGIGDAVGIEEEEGFVEVIKDDKRTTH